jgi:hypothetical protein
LHQQFINITDNDVGSATKNLASSTQAQPMPSVILLIQAVSGDGGDVALKYSLAKPKLTANALLILLVL